jgi:hypothetical protein
MKDYTKKINKLIKMIPTDFPCPPGCAMCCNKHRWTWTEWSKVENKIVALEMDSKCPYASNDGCRVYEQRPVICRLYGNCSEPLGDWRGIQDISIGCPLGIKPISPLPRKEARRIFRRYMEIMESEEVDGFNADHCTLPAGPFGAFIRPDAGLVVLANDETRRQGFESVLGVHLDADNRGENSASQDGRQD